MCTYHYEKMNYKSEKRPSGLSETPCTNIPIRCPLCPLSASGKPHTIWKYNGTYNIVIHHATDSSSDSISILEQPFRSGNRDSGFRYPPEFLMKQPDIPPQLMSDIFISRQDELHLEILTEVTTKVQEDQGLPQVIVCWCWQKGWQGGKRDKRGRGRTP